MSRVLYCMPTVETSASHGESWEVRGGEKFNAGIGLIPASTV